MLWFLSEVSLFGAAAARAQPCLLVMQPPKFEGSTARPAARKRRCFVLCGVKYCCLQGFIRHLDLYGCYLVRVNLVGHIRRSSM